ncbi:periplasmic chaperone for outer membrane proteins SurA [Capnocytophaga haemolytica]|jgi:ppiC-type peptidyl-prolyl cis-trans isomerase|uniref:Peptidyl-prolyl cis-trans isomerase surA n=1 Tax=Capnocytophaga haemolytica TaxID=45243 RepID=A0AAX2GTX9_9FLAO|nr:peptidylprolyl isomerase [Capnocytophaga haemolytica]AMD85505.1 peptidylprolyl isomerase [Capnocytophaga haemolytica]SFO18122.1 periplasmic chaperone for outer membrane proteins SurA [Capnocytophaga haemolytica]SNV00862.1 Peptidyl-prolyl cis-trans isomerase surA [Capnocytophaga haemolytica]
MKNIRILCLLAVVLLSGQLWGQTSERKKVDGVAAVVGDYLILESDIDKAFIDMKQQEIDTKDITRCQMLGKLMEDKLYAHQAVQDSVKLSDSEVRDAVNQRIEFLTAQLGGDIKKLMEFYKKDDEQAMRDELFDTFKVSMLAQRMKSQIVKDVEVTPEEVRTFFNNIPVEDRPHFGTELEIAQIVVNPVAPKSEVQKVIDQLNDIKEDVEKNGASFSTKAILYSQDRGTGGQVLTFNRNSSFDKAFKDVAFTLQEGEISKPFESSFGWHIIQMDKIRGKEVSVRHILLMPVIPQAALDEAKEKIEKIRSRIVNKELTFDEAARSLSDEKETRNDGGQLINPEDLSTRFELTRIEPSLYARISDLKDNEVSIPFLDEDRTGKKTYKIYQITNRIDEHQADFVKDYVKIQDLALKEKQLKAITKWMKEHIEKTYVAVNGEYRKCQFTNNWLKK